MFVALSRDHACFFCFFFKGLTCLVSFYSAQPHPFYILYRIMWPKICVCVFWNYHFFFFFFSRMTALKRKYNVLWVNVIFRPKKKVREKEKCKNRSGGERVGILHMGRLNCYWSHNGVREAFLPQASRLFICGMFGKQMKGNKWKWRHSKETFPLITV